jgi:hypothetical protein
MPVVMPAPPPVLASFQVLYNGLLMGPGTRYRINLVDGLRSLPPIRSTDSDRLDDPGSFSGHDTPGPRTLTFTLTVQGTSAADFEAALTALEAALVPRRQGTLALQFKLPAKGPRQAGARVRRLNNPTDPTYILARCKVDVEFFCPDPRIYDDVLTTTVIPIGGATVLTNIGNFESRPVVTVIPSAAAVGIANANDGSALVLLANAFGAIPNPTVIDLLARSVVDGNTGANRFDMVAPTSTWPVLVPGTNAISVAGASTSWAWRSAWIS